jgi:hypothetical protein
MTEITVNAVNSTFTYVELTFSSPLITGTTVKVQVTTLMTDFDFNDAATGGLLIGYNYLPYQSVVYLPETLTVEPVIVSESMYVSSLGDGGSLKDKAPYDNPLLHLPINDANFVENQIYNIEPMRFSGFSIDSGFAKMPAFIPGSLGSSFVLSSILKDYRDRYFYSVCGTEFKFVTDNLKIGEPRKIFIPILVRVKESSDDTLLKGEYLMMIVSRTAYLETDNYTGYEADGVSVMAVYRLPNKPIARV